MDIKDFTEIEQKQIKEGLSTAEISDKEAANKILALVPEEWIKRIPFFVRGHATTKTIERIANQFPELYAVAKQSGELPEKEREELRKIITGIFEEKMNKSIEVLLEEYASIRAGRANPHVLDRIKVEYYGTPTPLQQVGNVSVPEPRIIQISPWEKSLLKEIEKAINMSDLGINPTNDGSCIRLVFPELTEERRKELVKDVKKKGEACKVAVRNIRRDAIDAVKKLEKAGDFTEDDVKDGENKIQKITDKAIERVGKAIEDKSKEILTV